MLNDGAGREPSPSLQRDRFVAFCFASTDLVMEVDAQGRICFASGAAQELTGHTGPSLIGRPWLEIFVETDRAKLARIVAGLRSPGRSGPTTARLQGAADQPSCVVFNACRLPHRDGFIYCTVSAVNMALAMQGRDQSRDEASGLLERDGFCELAEESLQMARSLGKSIELTLIELSGPDSEVAPLRAGQRNRFVSALGTVLREKAVGSDLAGRLADQRFGVIHDAEVDGSEIEQGILELASAFLPGDTALTVGRNTVELDCAGLTESEAGQALIYTINQFASGGTEALTLSSLKAGFQSLARATGSRIAQLKRFVSKNAFDFHLQPIVTLEHRALEHYELLIRLQEGQSPYLWITLAEGVGLIQDLDLAVARRALHFLEHEAADPGLQLAINLSGLSLATPLLVEQLLEVLSAHPLARDRLLIEVTESSRIEDLDQANRQIGALKAQGVRVGLDDFGAGAACFKYLRHMDVDFVKIDGAYVQGIQGSSRDRLMLKAMAGLCRDLGVATVAEMVEREEQVDQLRRLGITLGQGYLFGRPARPADLGLLADGDARRLPAERRRTRFDPFTKAEVNPARQQPAGKARAVNEG